MNILVLMAGKTRIGDADSIYPVYLMEFEGKLVIERLVESFKPFGDDVRLIFAIREEDAERAHLDAVISLLVPDAKIIEVQGETDGAACTALLAIDHINTDDPLAVVNADEIIDVDYAAVLKDFQKRDLDAGVIVFPSVHPRYSFVKLDDDGNVIQAAEKVPISTHATAGFYYYRHGADFVAMTMEMIRKEARVNDKFYICPVFNELILAQKRIGVFPIEAMQYHPLKSDHQLQQFSLDIEDHRRHEI